MAAVKRKNKMNYKKLVTPFIKERTRAVVNPFLTTEKKTPDRPATIFIYDYDAEKLNYAGKATSTENYKFYDTPTVTWVNMDGTNKKDIENICTRFGVHM